MGAKTWRKEELEILEDKWGASSIPQIAKILGKSVNAIRCKAQKIGLESFIDCGEYVTFNKLIKDFWKWAEQHKQDISFAKFEKGSIGEEPAWVGEKRKADLTNPSKVNHNRKWTKEQDNLLIEKTKSCRYTYKDLARDFNRTENAIKRRLYDLAVPYRPVPLDTHIKWTEEENKKMFELHEKGYDTYAIAQILNKTHLSISDRLKKVVV